jgi:hypothetical protein
LKSNKEVRHGTYSNFKNGSLNVSGNYSNNKKIGEWKYFMNGAQVEFYDFTKDSIILRTKSNIVYQVFDDQNYIDKKLEIEPRYIGGKPGLERALNDVMKYPASTRRIGLEGNVDFSIEIDDNGRITDIKFLDGPKSKFPDGALKDMHVNGVQDLFNEIKNGLMKIEQLWIPGSIDNNHYQCRLQFTMEFSLVDCGNYGCSTMFIK